MSSERIGRFLLACVTITALVYWPAFAPLPAFAWGVAVGGRPQ